MNSTKRVLFILSLAFAVLASCTPKKDPSYTKDPMDSAVQKMDRGDTDGAINDLEDLVGHDDRPIVRETLASAYAYRAGVNLDSYWQFLVGFTAPDIGPQEVKSTPAVSHLRTILKKLSAAGDTESDSKTLTDLSNTIGSLELWQQRVSELPTIDGDNRTDVQNAIDVLNSDSGRGGHLYRALLELILLKTDLVNGFDDWDDLSNHLKEIDVKNPGSEKNKHLLCYKSVKDFAQWINLIIKRLEATATDLAYAYPSRAPDITKAVVETEAFAGQLNNVQAGPCL